MHPCILDLSCPLFTKYMTLILHDIPASEVHYMKAMNEAWPRTKRWTLNFSILVLTASAILLKQKRYIWSSRLVVKVDHQGWSLKLVANVGRHCWSPMLVVKVVVIASPSISNISRGVFFMGRVDTSFLESVFNVWVDFRFLRTLEQASLQRESSSQSRSWTFLQPTKRSIFGPNMKASLYESMIFIALVLMASDFSWFTGPEYHFS